MNRKLYRAMLALSTAASVFTLLLLAGSPVSANHAGPGPLRIAAIPAVAVAATMTDDLIARRRLRHSRALLALPYFSFAQALRRNRS